MKYRGNCLTLRLAIGLLRDENKMTAGTFSVPLALMPDGGRQGEKSGASHHLFLRSLLRPFTTSPKEVASLAFTARIERPPLHRGGSASKKDGLAAAFLSV